MSMYQLNLGLVGYSVHTTGASVANVISLTTICLALGFVAYNILFHPLRKYPGPKAWAASRLPYAYNDVTGNVHHRILKLHKRYGSVVRVSPDELSYTSESAWQTIYGNRPGKSEMRKARQLPLLKTGARSVVTIADIEQHKRRRGLLQYGFTEYALRQQEHYIQQYADLLVKKLESRAEKGTIDLVPWLNWTTFDIIGDLAFGQPFGCLENTTNHMYVSSVFQMFKFMPVFQAINYYGLAPLVKYLTPKKRLQGWKDVQAFTHGVMLKRLARQDTDDRKDFVWHMRQDRRGYNLSDPQLESEANTLVVAGSETTATAMSGTIYYLLCNPTAYERAKHEVRRSFFNAAEITMLSTSKLAYLRAVILEGMRLYPPAVVTFPRTVPKGGEIIEGRYVPGGTAAGVHHLSAYRSADNWARPDEFLPERWLDCDDTESDFHNDKRNVLQPFSYGPRNCLGKGMAWAEMHIIMAKLLWSFDMELDESSRGWEKQRIFLVWEKTPLMVRLKMSSHPGRN